jgi:hypothetical protein
LLLGVSDGHPDAGADRHLAPVHFDGSFQRPPIRSAAEAAELFSGMSPRRMANS